MSRSHRAGTRVFGIAGFGKPRAGRVRGAAGQEDSTGRIMLKHYHLSSPAGVIVIPKHSYALPFFPLWEMGILLYFPIWDSGIRSTMLGAQCWDSSLWARQHLLLFLPGVVVLSEFREVMLGINYQCCLPYSQLNGCIFSPCLTFPCSNRKATGFLCFIEKLIRGHVC